MLTPGYYWLEFKDGNFEVAKWDGLVWILSGCSIPFFQSSIEGLLKHIGPKVRKPHRDKDTCQK